MPLKHATETWLVLLLAISIVMAGVACAVLPAPASAPVLWVILFALSIAYPLSLYPLFKERRADYVFRAMHFLPAAILFVWLMLQLLNASFPAARTLTHWYVWGWSLPVVTLSLLGVLWFCLHVIRQRRQRMTYLAALFVPFLIIAMAGENQQWPQTIASLLSGEGPQITTTGSVIVGTISSAGSSNLGQSDDPTEEKLRAALRRMERRQQRLARLQEEPDPVYSAVNGVLVTANIPSKSPTTQPPHLPSSGPGIEVFAVVIVAGYCALLQKRAMLRV